MYSVHGSLSLQSPSGSSEDITGAVAVLEPSSANTARLHCPAEGQDHRTLASGRPGSRVVLFGGERLPGPVHMSWNWVSFRRESLQQHEEEWASIVRADGSWNTQAARDGGFYPALPADELPETPGVCVPMPVRPSRKKASS